MHGASLHSNQKQHIAIHASGHDSLLRHVFRQTRHFSIPIHPYLYQHLLLFSSLSMLSFVNLRAVPRDVLNLFFLEAESHPPLALPSFWSGLWHHLFDLDR